MTTAERMLADWSARARLVRSLGPGEKWPAWSKGELLAVSIILNDTEQLNAMEYTLDEALERLRYDIGEPSAAAAAAVFDRLREQLE